MSDSSDHPHGRGEHQETAEDVVQEVGSPPRAWGALFLTCGFTSELAVWLGTWC
jgi:hypothetical protein